MSEPLAITLLTPTPEAITVVGGQAGSPTISPGAPMAVSVTQLPPIAVVTTSTPSPIAVTLTVGGQGPAGVGVPEGGTTGQALVKHSSTNYDTEWKTISGGETYEGSSTILLTAKAFSVKASSIGGSSLNVEGTPAAGKVVGYKASGSGLEWTTGGGGGTTYYADKETLELTNIAGKETFSIHEEGVSLGKLASSLLGPVVGSFGLRKLGRREKEARRGDVPWKDPVIVATAAALPSYTQSGSGATGELNASANGALTIDGVTPVEAGWRVLVKNAVEAKHNGIYQVIEPGSESTKWRMTRDVDAITGYSLEGAVVYVGKGASLKETHLACRASSITVDTTALTWTVIGNTYTGTAPIIVTSGNAIELKAQGVTTTYLAEEAVTEPKLSPRCVSLGKLAEAVEARLLPIGGAKNELIAWKASGEGQWKKLINANVEASSTRTGEGNLNKTTTIKGLAESLTEHLCVGGRVEGEGIPEGVLIKEVKATEVVITKAATITKEKVTLTFKETDAIEHSKLVGGGGAINATGGPFGLVQGAGRAGGQIVCGGLVAAEKPSLTLKAYNAEGTPSITLSGVTNNISMSLPTGSKLTVANGALVVAAEGEVEFKGASMKWRADTWNGVVTSVPTGVIGTNQLNTLEGSYFRFATITEAVYAIGGVKYEPAKDGLICRILNTTTKPITLKHEVTEVEVEAGIKEAVPAKERILCVNGADIVIKQDQMAELVYDHNLERWRARPLSYSAGEGLELTEGRNLKIKAAAVVSAMLAEGLTVKGGFTVEGTLKAEGAGTIAKTLKVKETLTAEGTLTVEGAATVAKTLKVTELTTATGGLTVEGALTLPAGSVVEGAIKAEAITAGKIAPNAVEEAKIKAEAVAKGKLAKAAQEELLTVAKPSAGAAYTSAKEETEAKPTYITLILKCPATATVNKCELVNGGVNMFFEFNGSTVGIQKIPVKFLVEKGGKWKATMTGVTSTEIFRQVVNSV